MSGETSLTDPAEDVPTDSPARHGIATLLLGTHEFSVIAMFISALHELDVQSNRSLEGMQTTFAATANVHLLSTLRTSSILSIQNMFLNLRLLYLQSRHPGLLSVIGERSVATIENLR